MNVSENRLRYGVLCSLALAVGPAAQAGPAADNVKTVEVTQDLTLEPGALLGLRLVVRASNITIDGNGAVLEGGGKPGDPESMADRGAAIEVRGASNVTLRNIQARGFAIGLSATDATALRVEGCNFSDNYHNPGHGWGELPARGGIVLTHVSASTLTRNRANRVWDGIHLIDSTDNLIAENDFSHCSNVCAKLWHSSRNQFTNNNLSHGIRIDRAGGEVHARDSSGVLIETGSDDNLWTGNDVTHGGDGIFIRVLNGWVSRGNVFIENDTSHANNNCIESWSPGNTYIRNKANHGSYGFWLGGSDDTRLIGNEAAYNGLETGHHNAPEPGFRHGGIVCVNGPGSHFVVDGNHVHHNNGGGIVFRGDLGSRGKDGRIEHWVIQNNRSHDNTWGVYGQFATNIVLARNRFENNAQENHFEEVDDLRELPASQEAATPPTVALDAPARALAGRPVVFDASASRDHQGQALRFHWRLASGEQTGPVVEHRFAEPGTYRVSLTVDNGALADIGSQWVVVSAANPVEIGTEGNAGDWDAEFTADPGHAGRVHFADDPDAAAGRFSLRLRPAPYPGAYVTAVYPRARDAAWNWSHKASLALWVKYQNPNLSGWQDVGPVVTLFSTRGKRVIRPVEKNRLSSGGSEDRWSWRRLSIPLEPSAGWEVRDEPGFQIDRVSAIGIGIDSYGLDPFTLWIDGLSVMD